MKEQLYSFKVDSFKRFTVIIKALEMDARTDAYTIAFQEFGKISRIIGDAKKLRKLPENSIPVKNAQSNGKQWAWIVMGW